MALAALLECGLKWSKGLEGRPARVDDDSSVGEEFDSEEA